MNSQLPKANRGPLRVAEALPFAALLLGAVACSARPTSAVASANSPLPSASAVVPKLGYPDSPVANNKETQFGIAVSDPYRWMETASPTEFRSWLTSQDSFA